MYNVQTGRDMSGWEKDERGFVLGRKTTGICPGCKNAGWDLSVFRIIHKTYKNV